MTTFRALTMKMKESRLFKDSFWAVFGNGLGSVLMLFAGILIARYLGRDVYGEYGVVKTNMFYLAGFSTFGLGYTATRFVAKYVSTDVLYVKSIIKESILVTLLFSSTIAICLIIFAKDLAVYLNEPLLVKPFRYLSFIVITKALCTTGIGILAGLGKFKEIAKNAVISGIAMLGSCVPLTYYLGLDGSLTALCISQVLNTILNYYDIKKYCKSYLHYEKQFEIKRLISFSFPVAMQEISYSICNWAAILILTKYSSLGEVGIYSATAQWNAIIMFLPGLLHNVVLSHLSRNQSSQSHKNKVNRLLSVYLVCTVIPFICVFLLAPYITSFYGKSFSSMTTVLKVIVFSTIPSCCSEVFRSELLAIGRPWVLFLIRIIKDIVFILLLFFALTHVTNLGGALIYAYVNLFISFVIFLSLFISFRIIIRKIE